jgi:hypothetical protein
MKSSFDLFVKYNCNNYLFIYLFKYYHQYNYHDYCKTRTNKNNNKQRVLINHLYLKVFVLYILLKTYYNLFHKTN